MRLLRLAACGLLSLQCVFFVNAQVVINEVMASNRGAVENAGTFPDWIEIYNSGSQAVNIGGYSVRSVEVNGSINQTNRYVFPMGSVIPAGERLILWCDSDTNAPGTHTRFALDRTGCSISLFTPIGGLVDRVTFGLQAPNYSVGRIPDGPTGVWSLNVPTLAQANSLQATGAVTALKINEWSATNSFEDCTESELRHDNGLVCPDWLEIYNASPLPVSITGLVIAETNEFSPTGGRNMGSFPAFTNLSFIAEKGFQRFICDDNRFPGDHLNLRLGSTGGDRIGIFYPDRTNAIDLVDILGNEQVPGYWVGGKSYGRFPDGGAMYPDRFLAPTPGEANFQLMTNVVVNEVLPNTALPLEDAIELRNTTTGRVDISHWWISDQKDVPRKFRVPPGTFIEPNGFIVFYEFRGASNDTPRPGFNTHAGGLPEDFALSSLGDDVWVFSASNDASGALTGFRGGMTFGAIERGKSWGPVVDSVGKPHLERLTRPSFGVDDPPNVGPFRWGRGASNAPPLISPLVMSEIYYHPPYYRNRNNVLTDNRLDEFIEIYNASTNSVPMYDPTNYGYADGRTNTWRLRGTASFDFPTNITLLPGEFLVAVSFDPQTNLLELSEFRTRMKMPVEVRVVGPYVGKIKRRLVRDPNDEDDDGDTVWIEEQDALENQGGIIELQRPDAPKPPGDPNAGVVPYVTWERIDYYDGLGWPTLPAGATNGCCAVSPGLPALGYSLQRILVGKHGNDPINWNGATPSAGHQLIRLEAVFLPEAQSIWLTFQGWAGSSYTLEWTVGLDPATWMPAFSFPMQRTSRTLRAYDNSESWYLPVFYRVRSP